MMTLRAIQNSWNVLVPIAASRGIEVRSWDVPPQTRDRGMRRLNWLRQKLGIAIPLEQQSFNVEHNPGAALLPIREIVDQYNALVPEAQSRGIRNVRPWRGIPSTSLRGMQRLQWLRQKLGHTVSTATIATAVPSLSTPFDSLTFGIEIECKLSRGLSKYVLADAIKSAGVQCTVEPYSHDARDHWKITTDGSLGDYSTGIEIVSPILNGDTGFAQIRKVCKVLTDRKCRTTKKCGLHIHVGWKGGTRDNPLWDAATVRQIIRLHNRYEPVINAFMDESRHSNTYCSSNKSYTNTVRLEHAQTWQEVCSATGQNHLPSTIRNSDRYRKINLKTIGYYGTVEFRQHHGTVKATEVEQWLRCVLRLVLAAKAAPHLVPASSTISFDEFKNVIGLDATEAEHFHRRLARTVVQCGIRGSIGQYLTW